MEEYKRRIELFSLYDHTNIEKHLEIMAAKGWLIDTIGSTFWRYKKVEPQRLRFSVVYYPKNVNEGVIISADRQNFIDLCSSGGWNYVTNYGKMHIFSTKYESSPPIDTDAEIQIECIHKFAKTEIVYGYLFLIIACILMLSFGGYKLWKEPVEFLTDIEAYTFYFWLTPAFLIFSVCNVIRYLNWYKKAKSAAENGEFTDTKKLIRSEVLWSPMHIVFFLLGLMSFMRIRYILLTLGIILSGIILYIIFKAIRKALNKSEREEINKKRLKRFVAFVLVLVWIGSGIGAYIAIPKPYYKIKEKNEFGMTETHRVYFDKGAPLDINDFKDTNGKTVSREKDFTEAFLLKESDWFIHTIEKDEGTFFKYTVTDVCFTPLLERCKNEIIFNHIVYEGKEISLNTDKFEAYRYYINGESPTDEFIFCNGNRIAVIDFSWEPSEEELIFAAEKLLYSENTYVF